MTTKKNPLSKTFLMARRFAVATAMMAATGCMSDEPKMVQGRDACVKMLMEDQGMTRTEAEKACDLAAQPASQSAHSGGTNNALLWYMIGRNSAPTTYYSGADGYHYYGGARTQSTQTHINSSAGASYRANAVRSVSRGGFSGRAGGIRGGSFGA